MHFRTIIISFLAAFLSTVVAAQPSTDLKTAIGSGPVLIGTMVAFGGKIDNAMEAALLDSGWLPCDGRPLSLKTVGGAATPFTALFAVIQTNFGNGTDVDGTKKGDFNIPDLRGTFVRGVAENSGQDPDAGSRSPMRPGGNSGNQVGSVQPEAIRAHSHPSSANLTESSGVFVSRPAGASELPTGFGVTGGLFADGGASGITRRTLSISVGVGNSVGSETRPANAYVHWIIRYK